MQLDDILIPEKAVSLIEDGYWVEDIPGAPDLRLKVRGFTSRKVQGFMDNKKRRVPRKDRDADGNVKSDVMRQITLDTIVEAVLLDWNITNNGAPVPFTKETARSWLTPRTGDRLMGYITAASVEVDNLQYKSSEELEKNSSQS